MRAESAGLFTLIKKCPTFTRKIRTSKKKPATSRNSHRFSPLRSLHPLALPLSPSFFPGLFSLLVLFPSRSHFLPNSPAISRFSASFERPASRSPFMKSFPILALFASYFPPKNEKYFGKCTHSSPIKFWKSLTLLPYKSYLTSEMGELSKIIFPSRKKLSILQ